MKCFYHEDIDSQYRCRICGRPLCSQCKVRIDNNIYCHDCYEGMKSNNINYDYSKAWAFIFSLIPGVGQMYFGLMQRGLCFMLLMVALIFIGNATYCMAEFGILSIITAFYSFFDAYHIRKKIDNNDVIIDNNIVLNNLLKKIIKQKYFANGIIIFGLYLLSNRLIFSKHYFDMYIFDIIDMDSYMLKKMGIPIILIIIGIVLLMKIRRTNAYKQEETINMYEEDIQYDKDNQEKINETIEL